LSKCLYTPLNFSLCVNQTVREARRGDTTHITHISPPCLSNCLILVRIFDVVLWPKERDKRSSKLPTGLTLLDRRSLLFLTLRVHAAPREEAVLCALRDVEPGCGFGIFEPLLRIPWASRPRAGPQDDAGQRFACQILVSRTKRFRWAKRARVYLHKMG
jgi:hypothetical protein